MARHNNRCTRLLIVFNKNLLQHILAARVEEVERFVENNQFGTVEQRRYDAHLVAIARREIAYVLLLVEYLAAHQRLEVDKAFRNLLLRHARHTTDEVEIFLRREEVDEETVVDVRTGIRFPVLAQRRIDRRAPSNSPVGGELEAAWNKFNAIRRRMHSNNTFVRLQKVEHEAEKRSLAGTVVAHKTKNITVVDGETFNVYGSVRAEVFLKITEFYFHKLLIIYILTLASGTSPCSFLCIQLLPPAFPLRASVRHRVHLQVPCR